MASTNVRKLTELKRGRARGRVRTFSQGWQLVLLGASVRALRGPYNAPQTIWHSLPGSLGPYEVLVLIGEGGMGQVCRARDTKLNRVGALKALPEALAGDGDRLARFQREAQVLASLNHPSIAHIHGFEDSGSTYALVMELVEGPTLAERIAQGPIALAEALPIARQIADALEAAHEKGIVLR